MSDDNRVRSMRIASQEGREPFFYIQRTARQQGLAMKLKPTSPDTPRTPRLIIVATSRMIPLSLAVVTIEKGGMRRNGRLLAAGNPAWLQILGHSPKGSRLPVSIGVTRHRAV